MKKFNLKLRQKKALLGYVFISPWLIGFGFFFLKPLIESLIFSFSRLTVVSQGFMLTGVQWENYRRAFFSDAQFPRIYADSIINMVVNVPLILIFSFFVANLLRQKFKGGSIVKAIFFLPVILSSGVLFSMRGDHFANYELQSAISEGASSVQLLTTATFETWLLDAGFPEGGVAYIAGAVGRIYEIINLSGIQIFVFLAGLYAIPYSIYEACYIEGATAWETFWKVTFPMISPLILTNIFYTVIVSFTAPDNRSMIYIVDQAFQSFEFGYSSALAWIYFLSVSAIIAVIALILRKRIFYNS